MRDHFGSSILSAVPSATSVFSHPPTPSEGWAEVRGANVPARFPIAVGFTSSFDKISVFVGAGWSGLSLALWGGTSVGCAGHNARTGEVEGERKIAMRDHLGFSILSAVPSATSDFPARPLQAEGGQRCGAQMRQPASPSTWASPAASIEYLYSSGPAGRACRLH